jgi:hypothetical protein
MKKNEDAKRCEMLEEFANQHSIAKGGGIHVVYTEFSTLFSPIEGSIGFHFEDSEYLRQILMGASQLLFWLSREGYRIIKPRVKKCD